MYDLIKQIEHRTNSFDEFKDELNKKGFNILLPENDKDYKYCKLMVLTPNRCYCNYRGTHNIIITWI